LAKYRSHSYPESPRASAICPEASGVDQRGLHQRFAISPELPAAPGQRSAEISTEWLQRWSGQ